MRDGRSGGSECRVKGLHQKGNMPKILDLVVGIVFVLCGLIFLTTRKSYEAAILQDLQRGWLTPEQADAKRRSRVWIGVGGVAVGCGLAAGYFLNR